jgi:hypothetical protein
MESRDLTALRQKSTETPTSFSLSFPVLMFLVSSLRHLWPAWRIIGQDGWGWELSNFITATLAWVVGGALAAVAEWKSQSASAGPRQLIWGLVGSRSVAVIIIINAILRMAVPPSQYWLGWGWTIRLHIWSQPRVYKSQSFSHVCHFIHKKWATCTHEPQSEQSHAVFIMYWLCADIWRPPLPTNCLTEVRTVFLYGNLIIYIYIYFFFQVSGVPWRIITGSGSDDWIYWCFLTITIN